MKVAFDVQGTLIGGGEEVHKLFKWFESKGCEMIIWSSLFSYAKSAQEQFGYQASVEPKRNRMYDKEELRLNPDYNVDIAVEDSDYTVRNGKVEPYLACNHMILVHQIPDDETKFEELYGHLFKGEEV